MASIEAAKQPKRLPDDTHLVIVQLESVHLGAMQDFQIDGYTSEVITYHLTTIKDDVAERAKSASVIVVTTCLVNENTLGAVPFL